MNLYINFYGISTTFDLKNSHIANYSLVNYSSNTTKSDPSTFISSVVSIDSISSMLSSVISCY